MTEDEAFAVLSTTTAQPRARWEAIRTLPPELQALELANFADQDWAAPDSSLWAKVQAAFGVLGIITSAITGGAGAAAAVKGV